MVNLKPLLFVLLPVVTTPPTALNDVMCAGRELDAGALRVTLTALHKVILHYRHIHLALPPQLNFYQPRAPPIADSLLKHVPIKASAQQSNKTEVFCGIVTELRLSTHGASSLYLPLDVAGGLINGRTSGPVVMAL
ncbi:hypothetical protein FIBSPDRAFT_897100 [Athelia psychrophila]|uniref:Secreted protein n=1 Tax=Athelia psychrophila TaxID=1759441 RepID=A0A166CM26_9AGAM|nr:hypothetical protein FIBSPDRAFT_897100 [Fibularhizoctonia sp. CBS 109695]